MGTKIDCPGGGYVIVNNPSLLEPTVQSIRNFNERSVVFHNQLMSMGVKAYRCNDGWVDRKNYIITFFSDEREYGWYWGNMHLKEGDLIFIGDWDDGNFAIIDEIVEQGYRSSRYRYHLINKIIRYEKSKQKSIWQKFVNFLYKLIYSK